jgi:hypothetical protein
VLERKVLYLSRVDVSADRTIRSAPFLNIIQLSMPGKYLALSSMALWLSPGGLRGRSTMTTCLSRKESIS